MIAVNDAWRLFPSAEVLYACDGAWWRHHRGVLEFAGERWSSHGNASYDDKCEVAEEFGLHLVCGVDRDGFSIDPASIHYGDNSGFQAVNLAIHFLGGAGRVILVGFDMRRVDGRSHFFGEHPDGLRRTLKGYERWPDKFSRAARALPAGLKIINCTPDSALTCFERGNLGTLLKQKPVGV